LNGLFQGVILAFVWSEWRRKASIKTAEIRTEVIATVKLPGDTSRSPEVLGHASDLSESAE